METAQSIHVVRMQRIEGGKIKAFTDVSLGEFIVKGLRVIEGKKGLFVALPQEKAKDGKWYNIFFPATKQAYRLLSETVLEAYRL